MQDLPYAPLQFNGAPSASSSPASSSPSLTDLFHDARRDLPNPVAPPRFGPPQRYLMDTMALGASGKRDQEAMFAFGKQGGTYQEWANGAVSKQIADAANALADKTAHLDDDRFETELAELQSRLDQRPEARPDPRLKGPSTLQLAAGGLFALLAPKYASLALAAPFQSRLRQHGFDVERTRSEDAERVQRWQDGIQATQARLGLLEDRRTRPSDAGEGTLAFGLPNATSDVGAPGELPKSVPAPQGVVDFLNGRQRFGEARKAATEADRSLEDVRRRYLPVSEQNAIAAVNAEAERARKAANDMAGGIAGRGHARPEAWTRFGLSLDAAADATRKKLGGLASQKKAATDRLGDLGLQLKAFDPNVPSAGRNALLAEQSRLRLALEQLGVIDAEGRAYLDRLKRQRADASAKARIALGPVRP